jgi:hypothetical protein
VSRCVERRVQVAVVRLHANAEASRDLGPIPSIAE